VITNAGGFGVLSSDYAEQNGIEMVEFSEAMIQDLDTVLPPNWSRSNPIDMVGDSSADRFARTFDILIKNQDLWILHLLLPYRQPSRIQSGWQTRSSVSRKIPIK